VSTGATGSIRVLKGSPTDEEIAAVTAVLLASAGPAAAAREVGSVRRHRRPYGSPIGWAA
jgi:hypothetical protein